MIYIISSKKAAALGLSTGTGWAEIHPKFPSRLQLQAMDQAYLDISGLSGSKLKKALQNFKKQCDGSFWGIIDPKDSAEDPAAFFFDGAGDYIGSALIKKGLSRKRLTEALIWAQTVRNIEKQGRGVKKGGIPEDSRSGAPQSKKSQKLPVGKFEGWKSIKTGVSAPFIFLFVSISEKSDLRTKIGAANFKIIKSRFRDVLQYYLHEANALLWMEAEANCLFLIPPRAVNGKCAVEAALKILINNRLIGIEKLGLSFPVDFTFAMHYGKTDYCAPGKTGSIISESVNYIFHLGAKKAETGRLTISSHVPDEAIPAGIADIFNPIGEFEGIPVSHSRRFIYE